MAPWRSVHTIRTRRRGVQFDLEDTAGLSGAGRCRPCRTVFLHSGTDRLALHKTRRCGRRTDSARLRATVRRIAAHCTGIARMAGPQPAEVFLCGAVPACPDTCSDGGAARDQGADAVDTLRCRIVDDATFLARLTGGEPNCRPDIAATTGDLRCTSDRHRPAPRSIAAGFPVGQPGHRPRSRTLDAGRGSANRVPCRLRIFRAGGFVAGRDGEFSGGRNGLWHRCRCALRRRACVSCHPDCTVVPHCAQR
ncbi:MAG: hypothetical protein BWZ07_03072 [Alphaproteobacteria bacterium ADurb.BinA280]|nr:MAG: hypothetical protein BWZ07_03072 [Alphaproteobacteria bacterium ADurb.BinA280]